MKTANIVHPNDPRGDGAPLTIIVKKLNRVESGKRQLELEAEERPYEVPGSADDFGRPRIVWRRPTETGDFLKDAFWYNRLKHLVHGWINPPEADDGQPAAFNEDNLWLLFDAKYAVKNYTVSVADKDVTLPSVSFPFFIVTEWAKPETFGNPPLSGSGTS